ncbi:MAG: hypothetical protein BA863_08275 [Desulfovibrio sp. S3730MH75]|nr:MAG: hypothetical protein BA863_08275 [Desulfovibrio sp. S3730MH75]
MSGVREDLIKLYSSGTVEYVHKSEAYQKLCRDNEGDRTFDAERNLIEDVRFKIDWLMENSTSYREQVQCALRFLRRLETEEKKKLSRRLVLNSYASKWSDNARRYFEEKSEFLIDAKDYFLSFTNRNPNRPNQNDMNRNHRNFIRDSLGGEAYNHADLSNCNLVAETVHYHLRNLSWDGFYYPSHEENNQDVKEKLCRNCIRSLAFVQLVQAAMFRYIPDSPNWCFFEYDLALKQDSNCVLFVQIEEDIREEGIHACFNDWYQHFKNKDSLKLKQTRNRSQGVIDENRSKIRKELSEQIKKAVDRIYCAIPD